MCTGSSQFSLLRVLVAALLVVGGKQLSSQTVSPLTSVAQIRSLSEYDAKKAFPVHIRGVVTFVEASSYELFVQDETGGIWIDTRHTPALPHWGDVLDIRGVTEQDDFAPDIGNPTWSVVGHSRMPTP